MSATLCCWAPELNLHPSDPDYPYKVMALDDLPDPAPTPRLLAFVEALLSRYPDIEDENTDTIWSDGPLAGNIQGDYITLGVRWSRYDAVVVATLVETAHSHGLHCFDPQQDIFYPVGSDPVMGAGAAQPEGTPAVFELQIQQMADPAWQRKMFLSLGLDDVARSIGERGVESACPRRVRFDGEAYLKALLPGYEQLDD
jgi:hypothetical protein